VAAAIQPFESALEEIVRERKDLDAAEAAWLAKVADYSVSGGWAADNYLSAAAAIGDHCHMTRTAAAAAVRLAVKLLQLPELAAAYAAGETSRAHVEVVARAYTRTRAGEFDPHQDALALLAVNATSADLYQAVTKITDTIDGDGGGANDDEIYEKRKLHSSKTVYAGRGSWTARAARPSTRPSTPKWKLRASTTTPVLRRNGAPTRWWTSAGSRSPSVNTRPPRRNAAGVSRTR
jgi:hypothetical protein